MHAVHANKFIHFPRCKTFKSPKIQQFKLFQQQQRALLWVLYEAACFGVTYKMFPNYSWQNC